MDEEIKKEILATIDRFQDITSWHQQESRNALVCEIRDRVEAVLADQKRREAPKEPRMTAAERDAFTRAQQEFDNGETVPAPADDVVKRVAIAIAQEDRYGPADADWTGSTGKVYLAQAAAALAVAREGWVPASELQNVKDRFDSQTRYSTKLQQLIESLKRDDTPHPDLHHHGMVLAIKQQLEGMVPASEKDKLIKALVAEEFKHGVTHAKLEKSEQQLATMYSLEQVEQAAHDEIHATLTGTDVQKDAAAAMFMSGLLKRLTAKQQPTEQERAAIAYVDEEIALLNEQFAWSHPDNNYTAEAARQYSIYQRILKSRQAYRAELAALGKGGK